MSIKPKVFVASSGEDVRLAQSVQRNLGDSSEVTLWNLAFRIARNTIDELERNLRRSDFGVFVFAPNDTVIIRGNEQPAVRDNVVLELGMFIGRLGKERSFIIQPKGVEMRLPTDLLGDVTGRYDPERAGREPDAALSNACPQIADAIKELHDAQSRELENLLEDALETVCRVMTVPRTPEQATLRAFVFRKEGNRLVCRYNWDPYGAVEAKGEGFNIDEETAKKVVVVRCYLHNRTGQGEEYEPIGSSVASLPEDFKGVDLTIKPTLRYVLAAPIGNWDRTVWGVVDFDASNEIGKRLLQKENSKGVLRRLARHLSSVLT